MRRQSQDSCAQLGIMMYRHFSGHWQNYCHSLLHGGPVLYGLSCAVMGYWVSTANGKDDDLMLESLLLSFNDIPDIDLQNYLTEVK